MMYNSKDTSFWSPESYFQLLFVDLKPTTEFVFSPKYFPLFTLFIRETCTINPFLSPFYFYDPVGSTPLSWKYPGIFPFHFLQRHCCSPCLSPKWPEPFLQSSPSLQIIRIDFKNKVIQANWISLFQAQEMPKNKQRQKQIIIALVSHIGGIRKGTTFVLSNMFTSAD